jgi:hypothetical protein
MQTVTLEIPTRALITLGLVPEGFFDRYSELEVLETLGLAETWRLQVLRLRSRGPIRTAQELKRRQRKIRAMYRLDRIELLEARPSTQDYVFLVRQRNPSPIEALLRSWGGQVFPGRPFLLRPQTTVASFRGPPRALRRVLAVARELGLPLQVRRIRGGLGTEPLEPPSRGLTPLQRRVLSEALRRGYYEVPRRTSLTGLAKVLGRSPAAVGKALRRAEGTLVEAALGGRPAERNEPEEGTGSGANP